MIHSTFDLSDFQYLHALRHLLPARLLRQAVQCGGRVSTRERCLPAYLVLGTLVAWFFHAPAKLPFVVGWLCGRPERLPSDSALYQARARLGWGPIRWLCRRVLRPLAERARDPSAFYDGRRLLALDGTTFTVADTDANARTFGRAGNQHGGSGYPLLHVVALCEVGTHALLHWITRSFRVGEQALAGRLWRHSEAGCLLLADCNFHSFALWRAATQGGWELLLRVQAGPKFAADEVLRDGSYLSWVYPRRGKNKKQRRLRVRVIAYRWTDEKGKTQTCRLLTSLCDARQHPARVLVNLYHRRWHHELDLRSIKSTMQMRELRCKTPELVRKEIWTHVLAYNLIRTLMAQAAATHSVEPRSISFKGTMQTLEAFQPLLKYRTAQDPAERLQLYQDLLHAIATHRVADRPDRFEPRAKKRRRNHYNWLTKPRAEIKREMAQGVTEK